MSVLTTVREVYSALLTELNKQEAPTILIEDFNYLHNKAIQNYINKRYNIYPVGQQVKDDLGPLKVMNYPLVVIAKPNTYPRQFTASLPIDYLHIQRQIVKIQIEAELNNCAQTDYNRYPQTTQIDSTQLAEITNNYYSKPSKKRVYFVTYQIQNEETGGPAYMVDFYCGEDESVSVTNSYIDYLRKPKVITLTQEDIYSDVDDSEKLEFAPYVNLEILKELLILVLENSSDPRLNTVGPVNQSIAPPTTFQSNK